jgi:hypothetical protein
VSNRLTILAEAIKALTYAEMMEVSMCMATALNDDDYELNDDRFASHLDLWADGQLED